MSNIEQNLQKILTSRYGKDVRQSIHDSIHDCYEDGKAGATDLVAREQIANLVANNNPTEGNSELIDIRVGADGTTYESAGNAVRNQINNTMQYGNIIGSSSGVDYEGEIKKFGDLDPKKSYLIWRNAYKTFTDIDENIKNLLGTRDTDNLYVSVALWAGQTAKTYDANTYVIPVTIISNGMSIACVWRGATTKTLELYTYFTSTDSTLSLEGKAADAKSTGDAINTVRNQINNTMQYGNIIGSSSGVDYEGEIKKFGDLDPKKSYLIWRNAYKTFTDIDENIKNLLGTRDTDNLYVSVALWAGQTAKTYDANTYVIPVTIISNGMSIACVWRGATTKTLELYTYFTSTDSTLSLEGKAADAKSTGDMFTDLKDRFGNMSLTNLISPDGSKWTIQVSNSGALISIPVIPNNALFIGNSLLLGFGEFGMAASDVEHDYYHYITSLNPEGSYTRLSGSGFEASTSTEIATQWMNDALLPELNDELDLVIVQLGDNVNTEDKRRTFSETCKMILTYIRTHAPNARVVWVGSWYAKNLKTTYEKACKETGCMYVDITDIDGSNKIGGIYTVSQSTSTTYSVDSFEVLEDKQIKIYFTVEGNQYNATVHYDSYSSNAGVSVTIVGKEKVITSSGVASHPGNSGMLAIANRIAYSLGMIEEEGDIF